MTRFFRARCMAALTVFCPAIGLAQLAPSTSPPIVSLSASITRADQPTYTSYSNTLPGAAVEGILGFSTAVATEGTPNDYYFTPNPPGFPALRAYSLVNVTEAGSGSASSQGSISFQFLVLSNDPASSYKGLIVPVFVEVHYMAALDNNQVAANGSNAYAGFSVDDGDSTSGWSTAWCTNALVSACNQPGVFAHVGGNFVGNGGGPYGLETAFFEFSLPWEKLATITLTAGSYSTTLDAVPLLGGGAGTGTSAFIDPSISIDPNFAYANQLSIKVSDGVINAPLDGTPTNVTTISSIPEASTSWMLIWGLIAVALSAHPRKAKYQSRPWVRGLRIAPHAFPANLRGGQRGA